MAVGVTGEVVLWVSLAFAVWLPLILVLPRLQVRGMAVLAAVLSWLVARAAMWWLPLLHRCITTYVNPQAGGRLWH